jgi:DNA gyrase inhibitor GyrI
MNVLGKTALALAAVSVAGGLGYYLYERNTEQPKYRRLLADRPFELREYPPLLVAETFQTGSRKDALNRGFRQLAGYIFAKSRGGQKISMTAPVVQDREQIAMTASVVQDQSDIGTWRTRFIMPAKYSRATLPRPPDGVSIAEIPSRRVAVLKFSGSSEDSALAAREAELRHWMSEKDLHAIGGAEYAFYNSPFIPTFMRRNEILIPIPTVGERPKSDEKR